MKKFRKIYQKTQISSFDAITSGQTDLILINGNKLDPFVARDDDAGIYGDITFELTSDNNDHQSFAMIKLNRKQSELRAQGELEERTYVVSYHSVA